ncbi:GNAT superfamily N-acetyltransferase [Deinobacterium chartae]|uniref:GNAT superfamily N-acetyltransferase n=1 Tax=Deinobacterium chartae TaxID=521158 RepID=A0A841HY14_9DEIO|nr:GNAT family N-acetyltransferase [Deinobacterium chartae]MBB6097100.1 GNAT superfamily N-acetyltransferase [Deinobacterium chartae]
MPTQPSAALRLRPFTQGDYEAFARLHNAAFPEHPSSPEELRVLDAQVAADPRLKQARFVAEQDGELVGYAEYSQNPGMYHPQRFMLNAAVRSDRRGQGIGSALYQHLRAALEAFDPISLRAQAREDSATVPFLRARGFRETQRTWESTLDPRGFDFGPYAGLEERLREQGIRIVTARELRERDPAWREQLHDTFSAARLDVPRSEPASPISLEQYTRFVLEDPGFLEDAYFVALHEERAIGVSDLYRSEASEGLFTGFTGVRREYRGRGVALALKLRALRYAQERGVPWVRTDNASTNAAMLAVNERLGFRKEPAWLSMVLELKEA